MGYSFENTAFLIFMVYSLCQVLQNAMNSSELYHHWFNSLALLFNRFHNAWSFLVCSIHNDTVTFKLFSYRFWDHCGVRAVITLICLLSQALQNAMNSSNCNFPSLFLSWALIRDRISVSENPKFPRILLASESDTYPFPSKSKWRNAFSIFSLLQI